MVCCNYASCLYFAATLYFKSELDKRKIIHWPNPIIKLGYKPVQKLYLDLQSPPHKFSNQPEPISFSFFFSSSI